ncbi:MAG TPA: hypothetical protein VLD65_01095 [Anaerolineales bacterium]|nr:hypothetical protein [Anaerolineales bacterium]
MSNQSAFRKSLHAAQHRVHPIPGNPAYSSRGRVRRGWRDGTRRVFTCACGKVQAGHLRGSKLVPPKWRPLLPPASGYRLLAVSRVGRETIDFCF